MMRTLAALALAAAALAGAGCGERAEPLERELDPYPVAVRGASEKPTTLDRRPERIVVLTAGAAELVAALGAAERLAGVPAGSAPSGAEEAAVVVQRTGLVDGAAVAEARPELIVASPGSDEAAVAAAERRTGAAVYLQRDNAVEGVVRAALELGLLVGEPVAGRRLAARLTGELGAIDARVAERPRVRVFVDTGFLASVPQDSLVADLVRRAGGEPVSERVGGLGRLAACRVLALRPEVVLHVTDERSTAPSPGALLRRCPDRPRALPRVARVPAELATEAGPRVGEAALAIARALHPDAFP